MMMFQLRNIGKMIGFIVIGIVIVVWTKAFWYSMTNYRLAEQVAAKGDTVRAITYYDRSLRWYAPLNPYPYRSADRLWDLAVRAEQNQDFQTALTSLRTIEQGFTACRSFYTPGRDIVQRCRAKKAFLTGVVAEQVAQSPPYSPEHDHAPNILWSFAVEIGLFGWIGSVIGFLCFGLADNSTTKLQPKPAVAYATTYMVFFAIWIIGMIKA